MHDLRVTLVQHELAWENPAQNRDAFEALLAASPPQTDLIVLPEMFTTGFSMNALANAEGPGGDTEQWMQRVAARYDCALTGSIAVKDNGAVFNRLLFATPEVVHVYDKRHLFRMAGEHKRYAPGSERVIVEWQGWRIKPEVCYDLRFPVFSRNRGDYDLLLFVANWPSARAEHWRTLLRARAIENLSAVVGVNRIGSDANGLSYSGDSLAVSARGVVLADLGERDASITVSFDGPDQQAYRQQFPTHLDADDFELRL